MSEPGIRRLQAAVTESKIAPKKPTVVPHGTGWRVSWPPNARLEVQGLRESRSDGIHAEVQAFWGNTRIEWDMGLNLGSPRTRDTFAKRLTDLTPAFDWHGAVRQMAEAVIDAHREGPALEQISYSPKSITTDWLVKPLLAEGQTTMLYADGGVGKSWMALWLAYCVAGGILMPPPLEVGKTVNVLYLDWETDQATHARRLRRLALGSSVRPTIHYRAMKRVLVKDIDRVRQIMDDQQIGLTIVDSVGWATAGSLNEDEPARELMSAIQQLPGTKLCLTHVSKVGATDKQATSFGSRYFHNGPRMTWEMRRDGQSIGLYCRKSNLGKPPADFGLAIDETTEDGPIQYLGSLIQDSSALTGSLKLKDAVYATLRRQGAMSIVEIADCVSSTSRSVARVLTSDTQKFTLLEGGQGKKGGGQWTAL